MEEGVDDIINLFGSKLDFGEYGEVGQCDKASVEFLQDWQTKLEEQGNLNIK